MNKIIYIVTAGSYSDYGIVAVYDNAEIATTHANSLYEGQVEEYEINKFADKIRQGMFAFLKVTMDKEGNALRVRKMGLAIPEFDNVPVIYFYVNGREDTLILSYPCYAKDEEHTIKITNEKRLQLIAADKWKEGNIEV